MVEAGLNYRIRCCGLGAEALLIICFFVFLQRIKEKITKRRIRTSDLTVTKPRFVTNFKLPPPMCFMDQHFLQLIEIPLLIFSATPKKYQFFPAKLHFQPDKFFIWNICPSSSESNSHKEIKLYFTYKFTRYEKGKIMI